MARPLFFNSCRAVAKGIAAGAGILLLSCENANPDSSTSVAKAAAPAAYDIANCALPVYKFEKQLGSAAKKLDSTAVAQLYRQSPKFQQEFEDYNRYETVRQLDSIPCGGLTLLALYREDESGHHELYYITLRAHSGQLLSWVPVAAWGSDGGWSGTCAFHREADAVRVTSINQLTEENIDTQNNSRYSKDSVVTDYRVSTTGKLKMTTIASTHQEKTY